MAIEEEKKDRTNGTLLVSKDSENLRDIAFREYKTLVKEENEVTEEVLVRDVLYACQGIDGKYVKFNSEIDGYAVVDYVNAPRATRVYGHESYPLRRLSVWFAEPVVKMRLMAVLVDKCKVLRGGAMAGAYHLHAQHGDPLVREFMMSLLRCVCSPLFEMVRSWVLEGELEDTFGEFFIVGQPVKLRGYSETGKSINFLRVCCDDDHGWAGAASEAAAASGTTTRRGGLGYGETDALEHLVTEAAKRIDKRLLDVLYKRSKFKEHCLAIKRYLLLGQGDFVQYLMDIVGPKLSEPANNISSFELAGFLEGQGVEHALIWIWKTMKPNCITSSSFVKLQTSVKLQLLSALRRCQVLWNEMNHFVTNFQYHIMFEVLQVSWCNFSKEMEAAKDLDDLLAAHEKYLNSIVGKSLLGEQSQTIRKSLFVLFELVLRFRSHADRLYEGIYELQIRTKESGRERNKTRESSSWISEGKKAITQRAGEFLQSMSQDMDGIANEYTTSLDAFLSLLPLQQTVDLKFLFFRLDFTEFYSRLHAKGKES
ncbi:hypothetical protein Bca4012_012648 [Brassica carinata]